MTAACASMPFMAAGNQKRDKPFRDEETSRRNAVMMWARYPLFLVGGAVCYFTHAFWPGLVLLGIWYAVWLIWALGALDY